MNPKRSFKIREVYKKFFSKFDEFINSDDFTSANIVRLKCYSEYLEKNLKDFLTAQRTIEDCDEN